MSEAGHQFEYAIKGDAAGRATLFLQNDSGNYISERINAAFAINRWYHLVVTYNGSGAATGITWYVDGSAAPSTGVIDGTYAGMHPNYNHQLIIGGDQVGANEFDGSLAEFAIWGTELSAEAVAAINDITQTSEPLHISGIVNNPPRVMLRDRDNLPTAFPTKARTGDKDFIGKGLHPFDDNNTIDFISNFSTAKIDFKSSELDFRTYIGLTGSIRNRNFLFVANDPPPIGGGPDGGDWLYRLAPSPRPDGTSAPRQTFRIVSLSGSDSLTDMAASFAKTVSEANLGMSAKAVGSTVHLEQKKPNEGTYKQGNIIVSGNFKNFVMSPDDPFEITQFVDVSSKQIAYPQGLTAGANLINNLVATPNTLIPITATGKAIRAHAGDQLNYHRFSTDSISPFDETRISIADNLFAKESTPPNILRGFSAPLKSKTSLVFDLISQGGSGHGTPIFFSTGTLASPRYHTDLAAVSGSGMAYWNKSRNTWERLEPRFVDVYNNEIMTRSLGCFKSIIQVIFNRFFSD